MGFISINMICLDIKSILSVRIVSQKNQIFSLDIKSMSYRLFAKSGCLL